MNMLQVTFIANYYDPMGRNVLFNTMIHGSVQLKQKKATNKEILSKINPLSMALGTLSCRRSSNA
jgi:hypothetical protein